MIREPATQEVEDAEAQGAGRWRLRLVFAVVSVGLIAVLVGVALVRTGDSVGTQVVDHAGLRVVVPAGFHVQDVTGMVDGELACPDAPGYVLAGPPPEQPHTNATCRLERAHVILRIWSLPPAEARELAAAGEVHTVDGLEYRWVSSSRVQAVFVDRRVMVWSTAKAFSQQVVASARRSPSTGLATPTTASSQTETTGRLTRELRCQSADKASTYDRAGNAPFLGQQAEAPIDCYVEGFGYRILVLRDGRAQDRAIGYYAGGAWLLVGPEWVITAMSEEAARFAHRRVGGDLRPPDGSCCGPPTSDRLPDDEGSP